MKASIQNLLSLEVDGKRSGPMSPVLDSQEIAKEFDIQVDELFRVNFEDDEIHNVYEAPRKRELTGGDNLVLVTRYPNTNVYFFFISLGRILPAALGFDDDETTITPVYQSATFEKKLSPLEFKQVFELCRAKLDEIDAAKKSAV